MGTADFLGIVAPLFTIGGYVVYVIQTEEGKSRPNPATWSVSVVLTALYLLFYYRATHNWIVSLQPIVSAAACFGMFLYDLKGGKFALPGWREYLAMAVGFCAVPLILMFHQLGWSIVFIFVAAVIAFWPTIQGVWRNPENEAPWAWLIWAGGFVIMGVNAFFQARVNAAVILMPQIVMAGGHLFVAYLARSARKKTITIRQPSWFTRAFGWVLDLEP